MPRPLAVSEKASHSEKCFLSTYRGPSAGHGERLLLECVVPRVVRVSPYSVLGGNATHAELWWLGRDVEKTGRKF